MLLEQLTFTWKKTKTKLILTPPTAHHTKKKKNHPQWIIGHRSIKLLEGNVGEYCCNLERGKQRFIRQNPKSNSCKEKHDELDSSKLRTDAYQKIPLK